MTTKKAVTAGGGRKLPPMQRLFVKEYLVDLNATQAAIRAGYSKKTAHVQGPRLLENVRVAEAISKAKKDRSDDLEISAKYVLNRLVEIDQMDALDILNDDGTVKAVSEWPKVWRQYISGFDIIELMNDSGYIKKIKWPDKVKNLELLGKHIDVNAFQEVVKTKQEVEIKDYSNMSLDEAAEQYRKMMG
ncbi:hypothetical protein AAEX37_01968 [Oligella sp. MSHR50489EDL]|uniref:terminase small subunit n=1 Tax=Oligella sp. MSHR50489EDL TaxID=3139409 RepID=UPI003D8190A7